MITIYGFVCFLSFLEKKKSFVYSKRYNFSWTYWLMTRIDHTFIFLNIWFLNLNPGKKKKKTLFTKRISVSIFIKKIYESKILRYFGHMKHNSKL